MENRLSAAGARLLLQRGIVATRDILDVGDAVWAVPSGLLAWMIEP